MYGGNNAPPPPYAQGGGEQWGGNQNGPGAVNNPFGAAAGPPPQQNPFAGSAPPGPGGPPPGPGGPPPPGGFNQGAPPGGPPPFDSSGYGAPPPGSGPGGAFGMGGPAAAPPPPPGAGAPGAGPHLIAGGMGDYLTSNQPSASQVDPYIEQHKEDCNTCNAPGHFCRVTTNVWPQTAPAKGKAGVPVGLTFQALGLPPKGQEPVPEVNFGASGTVVRCRSCRTYINPFVRWEGNGRRWICNMCGGDNDTTSTYYNQLDETGRRVDRFERPELSCGSVEYVAPGEYMIRAPQPAVFMFVIDVSFQAVKTGMTQVAVSAIRSAIQGINSGESIMVNGESRTQVGIITFDSTVHFYNLNPNVKEGVAPQMVVVPSIDDMFLPLPDYILVNAAEAEAKIDQVLDSIPQVFKEEASKIQDGAALGSAVQGAYLAMKSIGGKIMLFSACMPTIGMYQLNQTRLAISKKADSVTESLNPEGGLENSQYKKLATDLTKHQIAVDIFCNGVDFLDLASLAPLSKYTGGDIWFYKGYNWFQKLEQDIHDVLSREMGWEAVMRVRVSRGWRISHFHGHLLEKARELLVVPNAHATQNVSVTIELAEPNIKPEPIWCVQCALLYTNSQNQRRIRVHTISGVCSPNYVDVLAGIDPDCIAAICANNAVDLTTQAKLSDARNYLLQTCQQIAPQLPAESPQQVRLCKLFLGMLKCKAFKETEVDPDSRIVQFMRMSSLAADMHGASYCPRLFALHELEPQHGNEDEFGNTILPEPMAPTSQNLNNEGAFLLEDGQEMYLLLGQGLNANFLQAVWGVNDMQALDPMQPIGLTGDKYGNQVAGIIRQLREDRPGAFMRLTVIKPGFDWQEFAALLYEDKTERGSMRSSWDEFFGRMSGRGQPGMPPQMGGPPPMGGAPPMQQGGMPPQQIQQGGFQPQMQQAGYQQQKPPMGGPPPGPGGMPNMNGPPPQMQMNAGPPPPAGGGYMPR